MDDRVLFLKPRIGQLKSYGFNCVDMHMHSNVSDGINKVETIFKKAKKKGFGVSITDHNEIKGSIKACRQKSVMIIPGIEVNTMEGPDDLFYFYNVDELKEFYNKH